MSSQHRSSNVDIAPEGHLSRTKRRQFRQRNAAVKWIRNPPIEGRNWQGGDDRVKQIKETLQKQWPAEQDKLKRHSDRSFNYLERIYIYPLTRVYVFLLVCDMISGCWAPHSKLPVLTERACYWGERQPDRRGSRRGEWGSVMLPERLPLPLCLLAESHHPSPIAHSTARAPKTPPSRLSAAHKPKSAGAFFTISGSLCWGGCCQSSPLIKGAKGEQQRYEDGGKK